MSPSRILFLAAASHAALLAATPAWSQAADPCKAAKTTIETNECAKRTLAARDSALNAAYQALLKTLVPADKADPVNYAEVKELLREGQRDWVRFKENDCRAKYALYADGTMRDAVYLACVTERTEQRTRQLLSWAQG
jgi:uncharacterized protein YecT (DUF1311 family)